MSSLLATLAGAPPMTLKAAVVEHLQRLCTTRRGTMLAAPGYGVDDVAHLFHEMPAGVQRIQGQIEDTIRHFEPRLTRVSVVRLEPGELALTLRFEIRALLIVEDHAVPVRFTAAIDPSRRSISA